MENFNGPVNWQDTQNVLLLNPRLPGEQTDLFVQAWKNSVEPRLNGHVGIATSGATGEKTGRLILLSKKALLINAEAVNQHLESSRQDIWMKTLPDFHVGGLSIYARASLSGARVVETQLSRWLPLAFWEELKSSRATLLSLVPTQIFDLVQLQLREGWKAPSSLRGVIIGGSRLAPELYRQALDLGWPILPSYGLTECGSQVATARSPRDAKLVPLSHVQVRIESDGRIALKSEALLTAQIIFSEGQIELQDPKKDGWLTTGDCGYLGVDGELIIQGRSQDFVKIGGEGVVVSRLEELLEDLLVQKPELVKGAEIALAVVPDSRLGSVIALATTGVQESAQELVNEFNHRVAPFERIRRIYTLSHIPRSSLGKLLRRELLALIDFESR